MLQDDKDGGFIKKDSRSEEEEKIHVQCMYAYMSLFLLIGFLNLGACTEEEEVDSTSNSQRLSYCFFVTPVCSFFFQCMYQIQIPHLRYILHSNTFSPSYDPFLFLFFLCTLAFVQAGWVCIHDCMHNNVLYNT